MKKAPKKIPFMKLSGAGNDFIVVDNRTRVMDPRERPAFVESLWTRHISVGAGAGDRPLSDPPPLVYSCGPPTESATQDGRGGALRSGSDRDDRGRPRHQYRSPPLRLFRRAHLDCRGDRTRAADPPSPGFQAG